MASILRLLLFTLLYLSLFNAAVAVQERELQSMLTALRARGYALFSNAIATSDLNYDVISGDFFTLFAPTDHSLFTIDMSYTASEYTSALRGHVIPRRLSISDLRRIPSGSLLGTLMKGRQVQVGRRRISPGVDVITVDGVHVVLPGLFYGRHIAVHGLGGILNFTAAGESTSPLPPLNHRSRHHTEHSPKTNGKTYSPPPNLSGNHSVGPPTASSSTSPPPPANFFDHLPLVNSSTNHSIDWPLSSQVHAPTPLANISDLTAPGTSSANQGIASPDMNQTYTSPPPANFSDLVKPPSYKDNRTIESLVPEPAFADRFLPVNPPEIVNWSPSISPAHDLWHNTPIHPPVTPITAPPPPAFSENDDLMAFSPSFVGLYDEPEQNVPITESDDYKKLKGEVEGGISEISPEDLKEVMETEPEYLEPLDPRIFDCWLNDKFVHVSHSHGYLYTRQQNPTSTTSRMPCPTI